MDYNQTLNRINQVAQTVMPKGSALYLFGSRARGNYRTDSDWDILLLLDKDKIESADYQTFSYPFAELGWDVDEYINPVIYTFSEWEKKKATPFYKNVMNDKIVLYS